MTLSPLDRAPQVVAGFKYTIHVEMSDKTQHVIEVVDAPWMTPRYTLLSDNLELAPEDRRRLQLGGGRGMAGGSSDIAVDDADMLHAAKAGVEAMMLRSNSLSPPHMERIISATRQVRRRQSRSPSTDGEHMRRCPLPPLVLLTPAVGRAPQVVAGIKYTIHMAMSDGTTHVLEVVDAPWMTPRYNLVSDNIELSP